MANTLQIRRGSKINLPSLNSAEFGFCTDSNELYIGDGVNNHQILLYDLFTAKGDLLVSTASGVVTNFPAGSNGYVLTASPGEMSGLKWAPSSSGSGGGLQWVVISGSTNAVTGYGYLIDATNNDVTLILPDSPFEGNVVGICDFKDKALTHIITIDGNGKKIATDDTLIIDVNGAGFDLAYSNDNTYGWVITNRLDGGTTSYVNKSLFDANTILIANIDNNPIALTVAEERVVGRTAGGNIDALTGAQVWTVLSGTPDSSISMNSQKFTSLAAPSNSGDSIRATTKITESNLEDVIDKKHSSGSDAETSATIGTVISGSIEKTVPVSADMLALMDSADSNIVKKLSWLNLKGKTLSELGMSGFVSFGGSGNYYSMTAAGRFTILRSGEGRINGEVITWAGDEYVDLTANKGYFIGYSATNTLAAIDYSTLISSNILIFYTNLKAMLQSYVILYACWYDGGEYLVAKNPHPYSYETTIAAHDHFRLGSVFLWTGAIMSVLSAANRTAQIAGADLIDDHGVLGNVPDGTGNAMSIVGIWRNASGQAQRFHRRNFTVSGVSTAPTAGATYKDASNDTVWTVLFTNTGKTLVETWGSTYVDDAPASGTLTRVSGTGDASITYSAVATNRVVPCSYLSANVPVPLGTSGATRYGIYAIYTYMDDMQTPNTTSPTPAHFALMSATTYNSAASAAASLGVAPAPDMTQFTMPTEINALEPVLTGFAICDGYDRQIEAYTGNGFTNGIRSYKQTASSSFAAGAVAVASAINVLTDVTNFDGGLSSTDTDVQKALETIDEWLKNGGVTNTKLANMVADTVKGRQTNSTGAPEDITLAEQTVVGRIAGGHVDDLTVPQIKSLTHIINKGFYDPTSSTPGTPSTGDRYIASATANGWTTQYIYTYNGSTWLETVPVAGSPYSVYMAANYYAYFLYNGSAWKLMRGSLYALGTLTNGNTYTMDGTLYASFTATVNASASITINTTGTYTSGIPYVFSIKITYGASPTVAWDSKIKWAGGAAPTPTASGTDEYIFKTADGGTTFQGFVCGQDCK